MRLSKKWKQIQESGLRIKKRIFRWIKSKRKYIQDRLVKGRKYAIFYYHYLPFTIKNKSISWTQKNVLTINFLKGTYLTALVFICIFSGSFIHLDPLNKDSQVLTYFITAATMIGTVIGIFFSLKTLILQREAENTTAGFFLTIEKNGKQNFVFFWLTGTVILFSILGLTLSSYNIGVLSYNYDMLKLVIQTSFFIIGFDFYLIFELVEEQKRRINPFRILLDVQQSSIDYLDKIYQSAIKYSNFVLLHPKTDRRTNKQELLASTFQAYRKDFQYLSTRINYLFDYHDKVLSGKDRIAAFSILDVITNIIKKYFEIRKTSSVMLPSGFFFVSTSDSKDFLTPIVEHLLTVGENYLKQEDAEGVRKVITLFEELVINSGEIKYVSTRSHDNPIFEQFFGYLNHFVTSITKEAFMEGMFSGALTYQRIGNYIISKNMYHQIGTVFDQLDKITVSSLTKNQKVVTSEVINTYSTLIVSLFRNQSLIQHVLDDLMQHLQRTVALCFAYSQSSTMEDRRFQQEIAKPFETLSDLIVQTSNSLSSTRSIRRKNEIKHSVMKSSEELRASLRTLSENIKNADSLLINSLARVIEVVGQKLIHLANDRHWPDKRTELINQAKWYLNQPKWFSHYAVKIESNLNFDALPDAVAKMGLISVSENLDDIAKDANTVISQFANEMLEKEKGDRYGFTEPRIMVLACYIGIYALKQGKTDIVNHLKPLITAFETAYKQKWFSNIPEGVRLTSPTENQLLTEVLEFRDKINDLNRVSVPLENVEEMAIQLVTVEDVKKFIREIWQVEVQ